MVGDVIRFVLTHLPALLFLAALLAAALSRGIPQNAERYLSWLLLLSIGVESLWAGLFHVFAPETAARFIGWQVSPFQFEIGVADIAAGVAGCLAFWSPLAFKAAVVVYSTVFLWGVAAGHIRLILTEGDYAPGNAGVLLLLSIVQPILLMALLRAARRDPASLTRP